MKISFFEIQDWEKANLINNFPEGVFTEDELAEENADLFKDSEIISSFINSTLNEKTLEKLPNLKFISIRATGFDNVDQTHCRTHRIKISNVPEYGSRTVAEYTFGLILNLTRKIYQSINQSKILDFNHNNLRGVDLFGKTIGIVGLGKIGVNVGEIARGFGMKILGYNRSKDTNLEKKLELRYTELDELIQNSDIVTLHLPLNQETKHIINKTNITQFKKGSFLINTARGGLIDTEALIIGLEQGILEGVALDVLEEERELAEEAEILTRGFKKEVDYETLIGNHILLNHPKVLITPHNAFNSKEALERILDTTVENIKAFINQKPINVVQ